ncbi:MAG TPA: thioredoxin family protein [Pyrinomonadaceae bacterium]|nr:thioredoxin family protein [Pyrinomonadaceae bacterium]
MTVEWKRDADAALAEAKETKRPLLVDFSAAPA